MGDYHASLHAFWLRVRDHIFDGISDADCQEWAADCGLLKPVIYESIIHCEMQMDGDFEDGDTFYMQTFDDDGRRIP